METPLIEIYNKPNEIKIEGKEEYNKNQTRMYNQFVNYKKTFSEGLHNIEDIFIKPYEDYLNSLAYKLNEYDKIIEKDIESPIIKNKCYSEINALLNNLLIEKTTKYQDYIKEIKKCTDNFINAFATTDFSKSDEFIQKMIQEQMAERLKCSNFEEIEINGEKGEEDNIVNIEKAAHFNCKKIILSKLSKERFESLFSQSFSIYSKLQNYNDNYSDEIQRASTIISVGGEAAPKAMPQMSNMTAGMNEENTNITDISIIDSNFEEIDFVKYFPNIVNLEIINTKVSYSLAEKIKFNKINSLKLENIGLINENFNDLYEQLRQNEEIRQNLRILSVKHNYISFLDYKKGYADNILKTMTFKNLELIDMSYNKLIIFQNQIFNSLESIKVIDLTYNNIAFPTNLTDLLKSAKSKKCLVLMTNNLAILKDKANIEYNNYLVGIFPKINYPLENLTLDNIFCNDNFKALFNIEIRQFKNSLEYLNLSNGQLRDDYLISLLNEKWVFPKLKYLILNANYLTEKFIYSLIDKEYNFINKFSNLKILKLSDNKINCSDVRKFKEFLGMYKNLEILELKNTQIENNINQFLRKKVMKFHDTDNSKKLLHVYNEAEKKIQQIFDDEHIKEKTNITIKINDLIFSKYTKTIVSNYPYLFERIVMENQFPI